MKFKLAISAIFCAGVALMPVQAATTVITFNPNNLSAPGAPEGPTQTFGSGSVTFTAAAELISGSASGFQLYDKVTTGTPSETGLGLTNDPDGDNEITATDFIQLDFSVAKANPGKVTSASLIFSSVQSTEGWAIYGSNTSGSLGTKLVTGNTDPSNPGSGLSAAIPIPSFATYKFFDVTATSGDILIASATLTSSSSTPEPSTFMLFGIGFALLFAGRKLRRA